MIFKIDITPKIGAYAPPYYPLNIRLNIDNYQFESNITFLFNKGLGQFDFGEMTELIQNLPDVVRTQIKNAIRTTVFETLT